MIVTILGVFDSALAEVALFAGVMILIGGIDDLLLDLLWWRVRRPDAVFGSEAAAPPLRLAVFVPAWDEHRVIAAMLETALRRYDHPDYRIYVGCYPNDDATCAAAGKVAARDPRVRVVTGLHDGPTTKADCLNNLWHALLLADVEDGRTTAAIVLHDAEDVVHPCELRVFDDHLRDAALV